MNTYEITSPIYGDGGEITEDQLSQLVLEDQNGWSFRVEVSGDELRLYADRIDEEAEIHPVKYMDWRTVTNDLKYTIIGELIEE